MTNYREVLRLSEKGFSQVQIAEAVGVTRQTVSTVVRRAAELGLRFDSTAELSDRELSQKLMGRRFLLHKKLEVSDHGKNLELDSACFRRYRRLAGLDSRRS